MTQTELDRAVANATGEEVKTIRRIGFTQQNDTDLEREPMVIDWDQWDAEHRYRLLPNYQFRN